MGIATGALVAGGIAAAGSVAGSIIAGNKAASATEQAADSALQGKREEIRYAQEAENRAREERLRIQREALQYAERTPNEMAAIDRMISLRQSALTDFEGVIQKQKSLLDQFDPLSKESGNQLLSLMQGKESQFLAPVQKQREQQRQRMEATLARTMGPGWRTSSAGMEAMNRFDDASYRAYADISFNALNQLSSQAINFGNQSQNAVSNLASLTQNKYATASGLDSGILNAEGNIQSRKINATVGAASAAPVNYNGVPQAANGLSTNYGNLFSGDIARANTMGQAFGTIGGFGANIAGQYIGNAIQKDTYKDLMDYSRGSSFLSPSTTFADMSSPSSSYGQTQYFGKLGG